MPLSKPLVGPNGLVVGIANEHSIAYGCAQVLRAVGAELAVTWLNEKARPHVEALAREIAAAITMALDVERLGAMESVFARDPRALRWPRQWAPIETKSR